MLNFDLNVWENERMGIGERNILQGLMMPDKFILPGMDCTFELEASCLAKKKDKLLKKESLRHKFITTESYLMKSPIMLRATFLLFSDVSCDMKHVFLKGYLMVMSYSLAVASNVMEYQYNNITCGKVKHKSLFDKVDFMWRKVVAVDACQFTNEEMWVLIEMCDHYPKKRFGEANIYNNLILAKDNLVIFTDEENADFGSPPGYGNPERLWNNIINIAIKMGAVDDLSEVVAGMRGLPYFLRKTNQLTGSDCFIVDVTLSYSITLDLEGIHTPRIVRHGGYHATSKSLVADLQLGQMMLMSVFNIIEQVGAFGILGVPTENVRTDPYFDSCVRGQGLKSENEADNSLLQEWRGFRGVPFFLGMPGELKDVAVALAGEIQDGVCSRLRPQLLHAIPFSRCHMTTWGTIRGYKMPVFQISMPSEQEKEKRKSLLEAFAWVMGVTKKIPKVGLNAVGQLFNASVSNEELKFMVLADGTYDLCSVTHIINGQVLEVIEFN